MMAVHSRGVVMKKKQSLREKQQNLRKRRSSTHSYYLVVDHADALPFFSDIEHAKKQY